MDNATTITATVPTGATTGKIAVTTSGGTATSSADFTVTSAAANPEIDIQQVAGTSIGSGATFSGFTTTTIGATSSVVFTILNTSATDALALGTFTFSGPFALSGAAPTSVAPSSSATFTVNFTPTAVGAATGSVSIVNNDQDENPYLLNFSATGNNPVPAITSLAPNTKLANSGAFTLTVNGNSFVTGSVVNFNGAALTTTFVSAGQLTAAVPASAIATAGSYDVTVTNATPGGGTSVAATFTVQSGALVMQDFEDTPPANVWNYTGSIAIVSGSSAAGDRPASSPFYTSGSKAWAQTNGSSAATFVNQSVVGYRNAYVTFRLASFSIGSTGNGADAGDNVTVEISLDNGVTWQSTLQVAGNGNAYWNYDATGIAETNYDGDNTPQLFAPSGGGSRTTDGYSTVKVNLPPYATQVMARITLLNNATAERWTVDDVALYGTAAPAPTITSFTPTQGNVGTLVTINGTNFVNGATSVFFNGTLATSATFVSTTQLQATVPGSATTGAISVAVGGQFATSATPFTVIVPMFYAKATGDLSQLSTYGLNSDGTGTAPTSFADNGQTFVVTGTGRTIGADLAISGVGSKLQVASGAEFIIPAAFNFTGPLDLSAGSLLTVLNSAPAYTLGAVDATSTIDFAQTGTFVVPIVTAPGYGNLKLTNGTKTFAGNTTTVRGSLVAEGVTNLEGTTATPFATLDLKGDFTLLNGTTFNADPTGRFTVQLSSGGTQTLVGNGNTFRLFRVVTTSTTQAVLSTTGGSSNLVLGNTGGGGYTLGDGTTLALNGNNISTEAGNVGIGSGNGTLINAATSSLTLNKVGNGALGTLRLVAGGQLGSLTLNVTSGTGRTLFLGNNTVLNTLNLTAGTLAIGAGNTLELAGSVTASATGALLQGSGTSSLVFTGGGTLSALTFDAVGTGSQLQNLTLNKTTNVLIPVNSTLSIQQNLTLTSGSLLFASGTQAVASATLTGGGPNSYVNALTQTTPSATTASFTFPLGGTLGFFRPLTLDLTQNAATGTSYTARIVERAGAGTAVVNRGADAPLTRASLMRYFTVMKEIGGADFSSATVTLTFGVDDGVTESGTLRMGLSPNTTTPFTEVSPTPSLNFTTPATSTSFGAGTIASTTTTLGDFALATTSATSENPLPVELTSFTASRQAEGVVLKWATASEKNNAHFEVQRSADGKRFTTITTVDGQGQSTHARAYTAFDRQPLATLAYYRLRQVDFDGKASLSPVVAISVTNDVSVFPNPARTELHLLLPAAARYRVLSMIGSVVLEGQAADGAATLNVASLPAGLYQLEVTSAVGRVVRKFIKQN